MNVAAETTSIQRIAGWIAVAIPTVASVSYVLFPNGVIDVARSTCDMAPFLCVPDGYYTDATDRALYDMQMYSAAMEELRRMTPMLYAACVFVMVVPLLYSDVARQRDGVGRYLRDEMRKPNGWRAIALTLAMLLLCGYVLFVSRSLMFLDVESYFRIAFTAPVSIAAYWCSFLVLAVGGAIAAGLIVTSISTIPSRRDRA